MESNQLPEIRWYEGDCEHRAGWRSEAGVAPHADIRIADDRTGADDAYRLLEAGTALLWRGDWVNARHLMQALTKRADRRFGAVRGKAPKTPAEAFARHRQQQGLRAALLGRRIYGQPCLPRVIPFPALHQPHLKGNSQLRQRRSTGTA